MAMPEARSGCKGRVQELTAHDVHHNLRQRRVACMVAEPIVAKASAVLGFRRRQVSQVLLLESATSHVPQQTAGQPRHGDASH